MKSNSTNSFLNIALAVSLLWSVISCIQYVTQTRELRQLASQIGYINSSRARMQLLVGVCMEYSKTNSAIDSILEPVGLNPKAARAAAKTPAK